MPITLPRIDDRRYDDLLGEALARIPVHTPEWTNFNRSDPGVTLIEVFAFLTEALLYRANQIPERNRKKFLQLLRIPLRSPTAARGLVTISNEAATHPEPVLLGEGLEVRAGEIPFRTSRPVDVLPVEARFYAKRRMVNPSPEIKAYYQQLYASYRGEASQIEPELYEAVPLPLPCGKPLELSSTVDQAVWLALLVRACDATVTPDEVRRRIANRTLSLGVVPAVAKGAAALPAGRAFGAAGDVTLRVEVPKLPESGGLPSAPAQRIPEYRRIDATAAEDVLAVPGVVDVSLPDEPSLRLWDDIDPLEAGVGGLPPAIEEDAFAARVVTWLRISPSASSAASFLWMGINAAPVTQRAKVVSERLPPGTGEPDQSARLAFAPVLPETVRIVVTPTDPPGETGEWIEIDDLTVAPPEIPVPDALIAPGGPQPSGAGATFASAAPAGDAGAAAGGRDRSRVFALDAESGAVRFGDGARGARPPSGAIILASYDYALGGKGNVGPGVITSPLTLPSGFKVTNPVATWGGADAETVADGERQISRYVQHRDRLVTAEDFRTIALRTPGVAIGRVEVLPLYHPGFGGGEVPGAVTLMLVPAHDPLQPDAPVARKPFLDAVCRHLDPRRLVTTEVVLRGPEYVGIWVSVGIKVAAGHNESQVRAAVEADLRRFLAPTSGGAETLPEDPAVLLGGATASANGWKLGKAVVAMELAAVANRTHGVEFVQEDVILARGSGPSVPRVELTGLELPRVLGVRVTSGAPAGLDELRGGPSGGGVTVSPAVVQVPVIPQECH